MLRTCAGTSAELVCALREIRIGLRGTFMGDAAAVGEVRQAPDLDAEPPDPHVNALRAHGWRSMVVLPLRREDAIFGSLVVRRTVPGALPEETVDLLETLAGQSVLAIHNARVFQELEQKTRELEVASEHKSEFLASMSHELRTPLNAVIGFSDVLLDRMFGELNERQDEYVRDIRDSGRHLLELINEILDLSKVEAGQMELDLDPVLLADLIEHGVAMVRERAARHGISLACDVEPSLGMAQADERKLKQVVLNLLSNAVKFTPDGGSVTVDGPAGRRRGAGQRAGHGHRHRRGGAGPHLRGVPAGRSRGADQHGGHRARPHVVEADRRSPRRAPVDGERARRRKHLLVRDPDAPRRCRARRADTGRRCPRPRGSVLIVEDDRRSAGLLRVYLEDAGYAVAIARDGIEALDLVRRLAPAAVILDVLLPRLNGWEVLAQLKSDPATSAIPVVIVSMIDEQGAGFALGAADYLVKPVDRASLLDALARCVAPRRDRRTLVAIDDDPVDLDLLEAVLAPEGWEVVRATWRRGGRAGRAARAAGRRGARPADAGRGRLRRRRAAARRPARSTTFRSSS